MATRENWEEQVFDSIMKLQDQVLKNIEDIAKLKNPEEPKHEDLDAEVIAKKTFDIIKKLTEEINKNGSIYKPNSEQTNKAAVRSTRYILL